MQNLVQQVMLSHLPGKRKQTASGWISFNAVCCTHLGESLDKRTRGGAIVTAQGGVTYHCFNCHFKTGWRPGAALSKNFKDLLRWLNVPEQTVDELRLETIRLKQGLPQRFKYKAQIPEFATRPLPTDTRTFAEMVTWCNIAGNDATPNDFVDVATYVLGRKIDPIAYDLAWSSQTDLALNRRVIIPLKYQHRIVGYTARDIDNKQRLKYYSDEPANFVFNLDQQDSDRAFVLLCEGPFDAMSVDGVAMMGSEVSPGQAYLINSLQRQVIVVPDFDRQVNDNGKVKWPGQALIDMALEYKWCVSFPDWWEKCKDINDAVIRYGRLFTIKNILDRTETNPVKIELIRKRLLNA